MAPVTDLPQQRAMILGDLQTSPTHSMGERASGGSSASDGRNIVVGCQASSSVRRARRFSATRRQGFMREAIPRCHSGERSSETVRRATRRLRVVDEADGSARRRAVARSRAWRRRDEAHADLGSQPPRSGVSVSHTQ